MNIFYLHSNPKKCAEQHCFKHVVKMITEYTQLLSTAHHVNPSKYIPKFKPFNPKHPSCLWVSQSLSNYKWLSEMALELCKVYTKMYGKIHSCEKYLIELNKNYPNIKDIGLTKLLLAMPDDVKHSDSRIAYRQYYIKYKSNFAKWVTAKGNSMNIPKWYSKQDLSIDLD
jgi:hypothetical protein